jgi:hypothetical protein
MLAGEMVRRLYPEVASPGWMLAGEMVRRLYPEVAKLHIEKALGWLVTRCCD